MYTDRNLAHKIEELVLHEFSSLCTTCDHVTTCSFPDVSRGVIQCEMFESESGKPNDQLNMYVQPKQTYFPEIKGICSNCSKVESCRLPKDQTGVWHCEEYE